MLVLLLLLVMMHVFQPGIFVRVFRTLPTTKERDSIFVGSGSDIRSSIVFMFYSIVLLAIMLMLLNGIAADEAKSFGYRPFLRCLVCSSAALLARLGMQKIIESVFFAKNRPETYERHYRYLNIAALVVLYPVVLVILFADIPSSVAILLPAVIACAYAIGLIYKTITLIPLTLYSVMTLPIYWLTVEVLPLVVMYKVTDYWI